ncbi:UDP-N-acetylglucosamine 2-epimerase (non-hydrolyzing) [Vibrio cholerae]|nr:putative epimerase [Vibrio cholerae]GIC16456.1 UDP-N-acetylglucosamine 2-epimerase (non-hydrolyzing) [Vibrio cholerae]
MRMPEEINRILTDQISALLFCPTQVAIENLSNEGFKKRECKLINVGDVMYDAALYYAAKSKRPASLNIEEDFVLVTIHRADNTDNEDRLKNIVNALNKINESVSVVCPVHPRTRKVIANLSEKPKFDMIEPVSYFEMIWLINNCKMVITDSGGLQKEAYFFKKYCITIREQTEWVELVNSGHNTLVAADTDKIVELFYSGMDSPTNEFIPFYGDGTAAGKIIKHILEYSK